MLKQLHIPNRPTRPLPLRWTGILISLLTGVLFPGGTVWGIVMPQQEATILIREAAQATEQSWEEFHAAAIGGTLASPLIQVSIEQQLHEARGLLMKARIAKRNEQFASVQEITKRIFAITEQIIQASQERKR